MDIIMKRQIVNFINFIRGNEPRFEIDLFETVKGHIDLLTKYGFKGTFLLQYDALINPEYTDMLKALPSDQFEIGVWFRRLLVFDIVICPLGKVVRWQISISRYWIVKVRNKLPCLSILSHIS